jgi:hypothetical protein
MTSFATTIIDQLNLVVLLASQPERVWLTHPSKKNPRVSEETLR